MPWSETNRMEQRARFVLDALKGHFSMSELCYRYGVSRKTGYKWVERYEAGGASGCDDRSRAPRRHPNATSAAVERLVIKARRQKPSWGPRTLYAYLSERFPEVATEDLFDGVDSRRARKACPPVLWSAARRKLDQLNHVRNLQELRVPPGNRLERLKGDRAGQYSIRINEQYRVYFRGEDGHVDEVQVTDYH